MTTPTDIINRSLTEIAARQPLGGTYPTFNGDAAGVAAVQLYEPAVEFLLRQQDWEFARQVVNLTQSGTPPLQWTFQYLYPTDCVRVRQVVPASWDINDPYAVRWDVGSAIIASVETRVLWTTEVNAQLVYTTDNVTEDEWDPMFAEQMVRYLGSMLVMPIGGRPDFAREFLNQAGGVGIAGRDRDS